MDIFLSFARNPRPSSYDPWAELSYLGPRCPKNYGPSCLGPRFYLAEWSGPSCLWADLSVIPSELLSEVPPLWELGSNYLLISRDIKNCMIIRAIYFKVFALANR